MQWKHILSDDHLYLNHHCSHHPTHLSLCIHLLYPYLMPHHQHLLKPQVLQSCWSRSQFMKPTLRNWNQRALAQKQRRKLEFNNLQHTQRPTNSMQLLMDCSMVHMVVGPAMTTFWMQMSNLIVSLQMRDYIPLFRQEVVDGGYWQQSTRVKLPICFQCWYNLRKRNDNLLNRSNRRLQWSLWSYTPWPCLARVPRSLNMHSTTKNQNC